MWPMELALISSFCSVKRMKVFDSPLDGTLIHRRLAGTHLPIQEGWKAELAWVEKRDTQIFKSWKNRDRTGDLVGGKQGS